MHVTSVRLLLGLLAGLLAGTGTAGAMEVAGPAIVIDGGTLWVRGQEVRIHGIDAPETSQKCQLRKGTGDCSKAAIVALFAVVDRKKVHCDGSEIDQCGRLSAHCATDAVHGASLVASGLAWAFIKYSTDYSALEKTPRAKRIGIWQSKTQPPWEYRVRRWDTASKLATATQSCPIKGNINAKCERIYHAPWSKSYAKTRIDTSKGECWFCSETEAKATGWQAPYRRVEEDRGGR